MAHHDDGEGGDQGCLDEKVTFHDSMLAPSCNQVTSGYQQGFEGVDQDEHDRQWYDNQVIHELGCSTEKLRKNSLFFLLDNPHLFSCVPFLLG